MGLGLIVGILAFASDLGESVLKRGAGAKEFFSAASLATAACWIALTPFYSRLPFTITTGPS